MAKTKKALLAYILIAVLLLSGCSAIIEEEIKDEDYLNLVTLEEIVAKVDNGETFNFILGNDSCPACTYYKEQLVEFHKTEDYKFDYMTHNADTDMDLLFELMTEKLEDTTEGLATPTTFFIVNGKLDNKVVGAIETDEIKTYSSYYK